MVKNVNSSRHLNFLLRNDIGYFFTREKQIRIFFKTTNEENKKLEMKLKSGVQD